MTLGPVTLDLVSLRPETLDLVNLGLVTLGFATLNLMTLGLVTFRLVTLSHETFGLVTIGLQPLCEWERGERGRVVESGVPALLGGKRGAGWGWRRLHGQALR